MTIEEFDKFIGELDNLCKKYKVELDICSGTYEPVDITILITEKEEEE
jgi:hypothetical protein